MDCMIRELEYFCQRIKRRGNDPVDRTAVFGREYQDQQQQSEARKELHPTVEPQIAGIVPQKQAEYSSSDQRPEQRGSKSRVDALPDDDREDRHKTEGHG